MNKKANILVLGNSGAGKSTLINAVLGRDEALAGKGDHVTEHMKIHENDVLPFRLVDTRGFEGAALNASMTIAEINKWMKKGYSDEGFRIHMAWFCIDATSGRITKRSLALLKKAKKLWKDMPMVVVLTKSYFESEDEDNIQFVRERFMAAKEDVDRERIIPVLAMSPKGMDSIPPRGLTELIELTNQMLDDAIKAADEVIENYNSKRTDVMAQSFVAGCVVSGAAVGAIPFDFPDATILVPLETAMVTGLCKLYKFDKKDESTQSIIKTIVETGTVSLVAKQVVNKLKNIPGLVNVAADVINAAVAGTIVAAIGEATIVILKGIINGTIDPKDVDGIAEEVSEKLNATNLKAFENIIESFKEKGVAGIKSNDVKKLMDNVK